MSLNSKSRMYPIESIIYLEETFSLVIGARFRSAQTFTNRSLAESRPGEDRMLSDADRDREREKEKCVDLFPSLSIHQLDFRVNMRQVTNMILI